MLTCTMLAPSTVEEGLHRCPVVHSYIKKKTAQLLIKTSKNVFCCSSSSWTKWAKRWSQHCSPFATMSQVQCSFTESLLTNTDNCTYSTYSTRAGMLNPCHKTIAIDQIYLPLLLLAHQNGTKWSLPAIQRWHDEEGSCIYLFFLLWPVS